MDLLDYILNTEITGNQINMGTLINVCGEGRSGTTMLDLMIGNGPEAFSCGEVYAWYRPWRTHHKKIVCSCGENPCSIWNKIQDYPESEFHFRTLEALSIEFVVDSSKELRWLFDSQKWAKHNEMEVFNILIYKEPHELAHSHWKRGKPPMSFRQSYIAYHRAILDLELPFVAIPFRRLVERPADTLQKICELVGMKYYEGKEDFWNQTSHHAFGSIGTRKQVEAGGSKVRGKEGFSEEFEKEIYPYVQQEIQNDLVLQGILSELKERTFSSKHTHPSTRFKSPFIMPSWYYIRWMKSIVRRWFPQKWNFDQ